MELKICEVARLLGMSEATIQRWIRQGNIPAMKIGGEYVFIKKDIEKWARLHHIVFNNSPEKRHTELMLNDISVFKAVERGGVFFNVKGEDIAGVLRSVVDLAPLHGDIDRMALLERLLQREKLASTGIGEGVAIPHPRSPLENALPRPIITTCFLEKEIDFNAIDGMPVFVLFMMLSATTQVHLELLSRLSFYFRDKNFVSFLRNCSKPTSLLLKMKKLGGNLDTGSERDRKNPYG